MESKYRIVIFDFDNTLCRYNVYGFNLRLNDINDRTIKIDEKIYNIEILFNDYNKLVNIFKNLKKNGVKICIASFGRYDIIQKIVDKAFPGIFDYILTPDNIDKETNKKYIKIFRHLVDFKCPDFYGKNMMIKKIMEKFNVNDPKKIIFFDDDYSNFSCSKKYIGIDSYNNSTVGINATLLEDLLFGDPRQNKFVKYKL